jgi:hypothetical protein
MGAFDTVEASYQCYSCSARFHGHWQTKFFDPDYGERDSAHFTPSKEHRIFISIEQLQHPTRLDGTGEDWFTLTPWRPPSLMRVPSNSYDWGCCFCGAWQVPCFLFSVREGDVVKMICQESRPSSLFTLEGVVCLDILSLPDVHFMDASGLYEGDHELFREKFEEIERMSLQDKLDLFAKKIRQTLSV